MPGIVTPPETPDQSRGNTSTFNSPKNHLNANNTSSARTDVELGSTEIEGQTYYSTSSSPVPSRNGSLVPNGSSLPSRSNSGDSLGSSLGRTSLHGSGSGEGSRLGGSSGPHSQPLERRESVYLPIDAPNTSSDGSTWPFDSSTSNSNSNHPGLNVTSPTMEPASPSTIHPSYGMFSAEPNGSSPLHTPGNGHPPAYAAGTGNQYSAQGWSQYPSSGKEDASSVTTPLMDQSSNGRHQALAVGPDRTPFYPSNSYAPSRAPTPWEVMLVKLDTPTSWLILYFLSNLGLTLYNKFVLVKFPYAWTLTGVHTLCGAVGAQICLSGGLFQASRLTRRENLVLIAFSVLYTVNIAVSNLSLNLVSVPFHQVVRAMTPLFTVLLSTMLLGKSYSFRTYLALIPVIAGVVFATFGDYSFTAWGFILTLIGTVLAAFKTVATNMVMVGRLKLHPLDLLLRMSPLAFVQCVIYGWWDGELEKVREYGATQMTREKAMGLLINGLLAFLLNVVSFTANKKTSALTMTVAANVKQVLTIVLAVIIFHLNITPLNFLGITLTLIGGAIYALVETQEKAAKAKAAAALAAAQQQSQANGDREKAVF